MWEKIRQESHRNKKQLKVGGDKKKKQGTIQFECLPIFTPDKMGKLGQADSTVILWELDTGLT